MPDRVDWQKRMAESRKDLLQARRPVLEKVAKAAVATEQLLADPIWHVFQQTIQARLEEEKGNLERFHYELENGESLEATVLTALKFDTALARARRDLFAEVLELPQKLIEEGKRARDDLRETDRSA